MRFFEAGKIHPRLQLLYIVMDVFDIYRTRFQIGFRFRDGHQFTGLLDCQARDGKALDFAYNASLAVVNDFLS